MFNFKKHISIQDFLSLRHLDLISYEFSCSYELQTALSRNIKPSILCYKQHFQEISSLQHCVTNCTLKKYQAFNTVLQTHVYVSINFAHYVY